MKLRKTYYQGFVVVVVFSESERQVADALGNAFDLHGLVVDKSMVLQRDLVSLTCVSTLACSTSILASAVRPLTAQPTWESISNIFSMLLGSMRGDVSRFSMASTTPACVLMPTAVEPSLNKAHALYLYRLDCIFDLKQPSLGRKGVDAAIVLGTILKHFISRMGQQRRSLTMRRTHSILLHATIFSFSTLIARSSSLMTHFSITNVHTSSRNRYVCKWP